MSKKLKTALRTRPAVCRALFISISPRTESVWKCTDSPPQPTRAEAMARWSGVGCRPRSAPTPLPSSQNPIRSAIKRKPRTDKAGDAIQQAAGLQKPRKDAEADNESAYVQERGHTLPDCLREQTREGYVKGRRSFNRGSMIWLLPAQQDTGEQGRENMDAVELQSDPCRAEHSGPQGSHQKGGA